ncbi:MAG: type II toxin-antitoxin system Phd/YefM family antitoxin [Propionibacteriaceae bacterium]|jgi:prevent-host-death family protein|nr:type II toxin-antitoxin system Phd/YefM family antitoxin [Propionibacteriaceae bacterium]
MTTLAFTEAKDHLSQLIDDVHETHERVTITRRGRPEAVLVSPDDLEELEETIAVLANPRLREQIEESERAIAAGDTMTTAEMLAHVRSQHADS